MGARGDVLVEVGGCLVAAFIGGAASWVVAGLLSTAQRWTAHQALSVGSYFTGVTFLLYQMSRLHVSEYVLRIKTILSSSAYVRPG